MGMDRGDLLRSCCDALDRLIEGVDADTTPDMSEEERAICIIRAAKDVTPWEEGGGWEVSRVLHESQWTELDTIEDCMTTWRIANRPAKQPINWQWRERKGEDGKSKKSGKAKRTP